MIATGSSRIGAYKQLQKLWPSKKGEGPYWWQPGGIYYNAQKGAQRITYRPIVPFQRGIDQDGNLFANVFWIDWRGIVQTRWIPDEQARDAKALIALPGSPVDASKGREAARWMTYALGRIEGDDVRLATRLGWIGDQFVWPGNLGDRIWYGPPPDSVGDAEATKNGLLELCDLGEAGYLALIAVGLSAASPLIRFSGKRNPILGFAQKSSRGKTTAIEFALSIWGDPAEMTLPGGSTAKGAQDKGLVFSDTPLLIEDLHLLKKERPDLANELLYYMGNGQRRVTSSRDQKATGGETRRATSFYNSESSILEGSHGGVLLRTWELSGDPMPSQAKAVTVAEATQRGRGAIGPLLAKAYTERYPEWRHLLAADYAFGDDRVNTSALMAGDVAAVRALAHGLAVLRTILSISPTTLPEVTICRWLIGQLTAARTDQVDAVAVAWEQLVSSVLGGAWGKRLATSDGYRLVDEDVLEINGETIAWRSNDLIGETWTQLDINVGSQYVRRALYHYGTERSLLKAWRDRGWLKVPESSPHTKWAVNRDGRKHGRVAIRVAEEQLERFTALIDEEGVHVP